MSTSGRGKRASTRAAERALNVLAGGCEWCGSDACSLGHCPWCGQLNEIGVHVFGDPAAARGLAEDMGYVAAHARPGPSAGYCSHVVAVSDGDGSDGWDSVAGSPFAGEDVPLFRGDEPPDGWDEALLTRTFGALRPALAAYRDGELSSAPDEVELFEALLEDSGAVYTTEGWISHGMASSAGRIYMARAPRTALAGCAAACGAWRPTADVPLPPPGPNLLAHARRRGGLPGAPQQPAHQPLRAAVWAKFASRSGS